MINKHQRFIKNREEEKQEPLGKRPDWLKVKLPVRR
jgi:hypothetical protein